MVRRMSTETALRQMADARESDMLTMQVLLQSAPVIKNLKISCMFTVPYGSMRQIRECFAPTALAMRCLCQIGSRPLLILYRKEEAEQYLRQSEIRSFLEDRGYGECSLEQSFSRLSKRLVRYYKEGGEYPHEIGIFLGYPLGDVRGFIEHSGRGSMYTGYWKVYSDVEAAKRMFRRFDGAREAVAAEFFAGREVW